MQRVPQMRPQAVEPPGWDWKRVTRSSMDFISWDTQTAMASASRHSTDGQYRRRTYKLAPQSAGCVQLNTTPFITLVLPSG